MFKVVTLQLILLEQKTIALGIKVYFLNNRSDTVSHDIMSLAASCYFY